MTGAFVARLRAAMLGASLLVAGAAHALDADVLFEKVSPSVWSVITADAQGKPLALGSAVVIGPGRLVTNCHVLAKARSLSVRRENMSFGAKLEFPDPERDLCQITVANFTAPAVEMADLKHLKVGARAYAIGNPRGLEVTLSDGLISGLRRDDEGELRVVQTSAPLSPGSSGGGLFDAEGRLIGITSFILRESQNLNFAMPSDWIAELPARGKAAMASSGAARAGSTSGGAGRMDATSGGRGASYDYQITDLQTGATQNVQMHVDRIDGEQVIFNGGARIESVDGGLLQIVSPLLGELDMVTPPGGWMPAGQMPQGSWTIRFNQKLGSTARYDLMATAVAGQTVRTRAGTFDAVRIDLTGWQSRNGLISFNARYKATLWYSTELRRVVRFEVNSQAPSNAGIMAYAIQESLELAAYRAE